jgi:hypothetical protein
MPKLSCAQLRDHLVLRHNHLSSRSGFVLTMLCMLMIRIRRYLFTYFTWKTLSNHVFEDLQKPKAPNTCHLSPCFPTMHALRPPFSRLRIEPPGGDAWQRGAVAGRPTSELARAPAPGSGGFGKLALAVASRCRAAQHVRMVSVYPFPHTLSPSSTPPYALPRPVRHGAVTRRGSPGVAFAAAFAACPRQPRYGLYAILASLPHARLALLRPSSQPPATVCRASPCCAAVRCVITVHHPPRARPVVTHGLAGARCDVHVRT